jgi:hypothetical protein
MGFMAELYHMAAPRAGALREAATAATDGSLQCAKVPSELVPEIVRLINKKGLA